MAIFAKIVKIVKLSAIFCYFANFVIVCMKNVADCPVITLVADDSIITANVALIVFFVTGTISRLIFARVYPGKNQYPA